MPTLQNTVIISLFGRPTGPVVVSLCLAVVVVVVVVKVVVEVVEVVVVVVVVVDHITSMNHSIIINVMIVSLRSPDGALATSALSTPTMEPAFHMGIWL